MICFIKNFSPFLTQKLAYSTLLGKVQLKIVHKIIIGRVWVQQIILFEFCDKIKKKMDYEKKLRLLGKTLPVNSAPI